MQQCYQLNNLLLQYQLIVIIETIEYINLVNYYTTTIFRQFFKYIKEL